MEEAVINLIGTLTGIFTSVIALIVSVVVFNSEKKLNMNSVKPLLNAFCGSHQTETYVRIGNYRMGPAILEDVTFLTCDGDVINTPSLAHYVYEEARKAGVEIGCFADFVPVTSLKKRAVAPEGNLFFVQYRSTDPKKVDFVKETLSKIRVEIRYRDVFDNLQDKPCVLDCSWLENSTNEIDGPTLCQV